MTTSVKIFLLAVLLSLPFWWGVNVFQQNLEKFFYAQVSQSVQDVLAVQVVEQQKKPVLNLEVKAAIVARVTEEGLQRVIFKKNADEILPIASLSKLMTALLVLEDDENYNFSKTAIVSKEASEQENVPEYGNLKMGEKRTTEELLNLMLIFSSNDAAFALSEAVGTEDFVGRMNQKAKMLGLANTYFVNSTGLDPENLHWNKDSANYFNYSTARDLLKLTKYILDEFPLIFEISSSQPLYPLKNGFSDLSSHQIIIGGKTGYTDEAGGCMILVLAEKPGVYFVNIILGAESTAARVREMQKIIDWLNS